LTEIPEHLLKRSRSAKAGKTGGDAGAEEAGPATASPSASAAATPAAAVAVPANLPNLDPEPVSAKPDPPYVVAAKRRRRIPVWALPVVAALPIWAIAYPGTMQQPVVEDPLFTEGALVYSESGCSGCHGAGGGGGTGYPLSDGSVLETFPHPIDQMVHVARGSAAIVGQEYGAVRQDGARRVAGARGSGAMPAQEKQLSQVKLEMVIFHERAVLSGEDTTSEEYQAWEESMRTRFEAGDATAIDLELLLACADPAVTPGATGAGSPDPKTKPCPGPSPAATQEAALGN
jgi:mono/diheme cytochrome c family protein